jgi:hypothetical protein
MHPDLSDQAADFSGGRKRFLKDQVKGVDQLIDELVAQIGRQTYSVCSGALHARAAQA